MFWIRPIFPFSNSTLIPWGWKLLEVRILLTIPSVNFPVRWSCFCIIWTIIPMLTLSLVAFNEYGWFSYLISIPHYYNNYYRFHFYFLKNESIFIRQRIGRIVFFDKLQLKLILLVQLSNYSNQVWIVQKHPKFLSKTELVLYLLTVEKMYVL